MSVLSIVRAVARRILPRPVREFIRENLLRRWLGGVRYEGSYTSWAQARAASGGYDAPSILAKTLAAARKVKRGQAAYERDSVAFSEPEYRYPLLAALLYAATASGGRLTVLDIGGGLGSTYLQHRQQLRAVRDLTWRVVEQPHFASAGNAHLADSNLRFVADLETGLTAGNPDVAILSGVLPYVEDPFKLVDRLTDARIPLIVIDRNIVLEDRPTRLTVQHVPPEIYKASYPCWILNEGELMRRFAPAYEILDSFLAYEGSIVDLGDATARYKGYTFRARKV